MAQISVVIPVFNEERSIGACLTRLEQQSRPFDECVIVNNRCTDRTMEIVEQFADRLPIRVVSEEKQGVAYARTAGFDAARSELIARIDADSVLDAQWCAEAIRAFEKHADVGALAGLNYLRDIPFEQRAIGKRRAFHLKRPDGCAAVALSGANMCIRHSAWDSAKKQLRNVPGTHEDVDLYFSLLEVGEKVWTAPLLIAGVSPRRFLVNPFANASYFAAAIRTSAVHGRRGLAFIQFCSIPIQFVYVTGLWLLAKPFDPNTRTWRLRRLFSRVDTRQSPVTS